MKHTSKPKLIVRFFIFFIVVVMGVIGGILWWHDGTSPVEESDTAERPFTINSGESISSIAGRLSADRFIRSKTVFFLYVKYNGFDNKIQAGNFTLKRSMNLPTVVHELTVGITDVRVTILEGWRNEEIAAKLTQDLGIPEEEFLSYAEEGYMFPDTYSLPKNATAAAVATVLRSNFDKRLTPDLRNEITTQRRTLKDVVILASILEREGRTDVDKPVIAGILLKRLKMDMPLDVDATLQYALGYQVSDHSWWKKVVYNEDKTINSPYNTYKNTGFPPAPISNPGLSSLKAAVFPQDSSYLYYLHDPQGNVHYAKTLEEQEANIAKYLSQ